MKYIILIFLLFTVDSFWLMLNLYEKKNMLFLLFTRQVYIVVNLRRAT